MGDLRGHRGLRNQNYGSVLTTGKLQCPAKVYPKEAEELTDEPNDRSGKLRWFALLLYLSPDIQSYAEQFQEILALPR